MLGPNRVLIVDDNPDFRETTAKLLEALGQKILVASNGVEALALCERETPQVVLMDLSMPGLNGHEVARLMRRVPNMQDALLIAISGHDGPDDVKRSYEASFQYHMPKPFDWRWFESMLDSFETRKLAT